jgi:pyruvate/2-oxoglutarate dehydrogenase complex dihydrolipoamide acyltransferase (E2) component
MPHEVIMPALGMAQDTGLIVAWHKAPGDAVSASDILFEVETDKSTMDVEAGAEGFVAALLAEAGEDAPVGAPIAIISAEQPSNPVQLSQTSAASPQESKAVPSPEAGAKAAPKPAEKPRSAPKAPAVAGSDGRILASPKARRLALEQRLDLGRLVEAGHPQPYHVADLDVLKTLDTGAAQDTTGHARRLTAELAQDGFAAFAAWAAETAGLDDPNALLAGLAAASLGRADVTVAVESVGQTRHYTAPAGGLGDVAPAPDDTRPDLTLRDLRLSRLSTVQLGAEACPVLTLARLGDGLRVTLECSAHQLTASEAVGLLSEFAGRMEQPLRHLL